MAEFLKRQASAVWEIVWALGAIVYWLGLMAVIYVAMMVGLAVFLFVFFLALSLLPESVVAMILSILEFLAGVARLGIRDGG